jgi:hypothetical protein
MTVMTPYSVYRGGEQRICAGTVRDVEGEDDGADGDRCNKTGERGIPGAAQVGGEIVGHRMHRPEQIDHDIAGTDPVGQVGPAPHADHAEQSWPSQTNVANFAVSYPAATPAAPATAVRTKVRRKPNIVLVTTAAIVA